MSCADALVGDAAEQGARAHAVRQKRSNKADEDAREGGAREKSTGDEV